MGTRNLTAVFIDGEYKVAQYGQWDGYPEGGGVHILKALQKAQEDDFETLKQACRNSQFISDDEINLRWSTVGADGTGFVSMDIANKFQEKWPQLGRDMGYKVIAHLLEHPEGLELSNSLSFAADSLFCEFAYVVDLDKNTFEVYRGFNKEKLDDNERFFGVEEANQDHRSDEDKYSPVRLWHSFDLNNLPEDEDEFMAHFQEPEEDEEFDGDTPSMKM